MARKRERSQTAREQNVAQKAASELEDFANSVVVFVNESLKRADVQHDAVANFLFSSTCGSDVDVALGRTESRPPRLLAVEARAGGALKLSRTFLSRYLRVGAVNSVVRDARWHALSWTRKLALLPLFKDPATDVVHIVAALDAHAEANTNTRALNAWVKATRESQGATPPRKRVTVAAARRFVETGALLADPQVLLSLANRLNKLGETERDDVVESLQKISSVLPQLLAVVKKT